MHTSTKNQVLDRTLKLKSVFLQLVSKTGKTHSKINRDISILFFSLIFLSIFVSIVCAADVQLSQFTDSPDPAVRGGAFTYTINVENNAADTANNVVLTLPLPATSTFVSVTGTGCSHDALVPGTVTCNLGNLLGTLAGGPVQTVTITVRTTAATGAIVDATATVTSTTADTNPANNSLSQTTTIDNGADLVLTKSGVPNPVVAGATVTWTVGVTNQGPNNSLSITVTDTLPTNMTYVSSSGTGWSCGNAGQIVTCTRASLANGATAPNISIVGRVTGAVTGTLTNTVTAAAATPDPNPGNTVTADVTVTAGADLLITKTVSPNPALSNTAATFTLAPRNNGPFAATTVQVTDTLPAGFVYVSASGTGWSCSHDGSPTGGIVTCTRATYAVGAANNIAIVATAPTVVALTAASNNAAISSATADPAAGNNSTTLNFNIVPNGVDLSLSKSKSPNPVAQGSPITSTIIVHNNGPQAASSGTITVIDTLNNALETYTHPNYTGANWSCSYAAPVITCVYNAALANGANTSSLVITTTAFGIGTITNNAAVSYSGTPGDWNNTNNTASGSVIATFAPLSADLTIVKATSTVGGALKTLEHDEDTVTYTLTVTNNGPGNADGVVVSDAIPGHVSGSTVVTASKTGGTSAATFTCTTGATVTCTQTGGVIALAETAIFTITATRPLRDGSFTNTATVRSTTLGDPVPGNNSASDSIIIDPIADVQMQSKIISPSTIQAGVNTTYVMTYRNNGPSSAQGVVVTDAFTVPVGDTGFTVISVTSSKVGSVCAGLVAGTSYGPGTPTLTCTIGTLTNGESQTITVVIRPNWMGAPPSPRTLNNTAAITTTTWENSANTDNGNNIRSAILTITPADVDVLVNKTDTSPAGPDPLGFNPVPVGNDNLISYHIAITNRGPSLATGVTLSDTITPPAAKRITFLRVSDSAFGAASGTTVCSNTGVTSAPGTALSTSCTLGQNIAANLTVDRYLIFQVMDAPVSGGDTYSDTVTVATNETDNNPANNTEAETTTVRVRVDLVVAKASSASPVQLREPFYWTITITNNGPGDSLQTTLSDTLPVGMVFYTPAQAATAPAPYNAPPYNGGPIWTNNNTAPLSGTCSTAGQALSCNFGLLEATRVVTLTVPVRVTTFAASIQNCATATTSEVDPNSVNNTNQCGTVTVQRSSIAGFVYQDLNNDGAMSGAGETGITGITVSLTGTDLYGNAVSSSTTTPAGGAFSFTNLSPANASGYALIETQPGSYFDGRETAGTSLGTVNNTGFSSAAVYNQITAIPLPGNTAVTGYLFGELPGNTVSGFVYPDANNNGVRDGGETTGIVGVTITLTGTDYGPDGISGTGDDVAVNTATTTDGTGAYTFTGLRAGSYTATETQPAGYLDGRDTAGTVAGIACVAGTCITTVNDRISNIVLSTFGIAAANMNFGELAPASLAGSVYNDANNNGSYNTPPETGIAGVTITLTGTDDLGNPVSTTTTTDASGNYSFTNLRPGAYVLTETQPAGFIDGAETAGSLGGNIAINDIISAITVAAGQNGTGYNFGERGTGLTGQVYLDSNNNGIRGVAETGIAGVTITLTGTDGGGNPVSRTTTTAADGSYAFYALPASNATGYTVTETQPVAWADGTDKTGTAGGVLGNDVITGVVLTGTTVATGYDFGELGGSLAGFVYNDTNNNGLKEAGEQGIQGVTITLTGTDVNGSAVSLTTTTGIDGSYLFSDLARPNGAGYIITETQPANYTDGIDTAGTLGGNATVNDVVSAIVFPVAGSNGTGYNFGERVQTTAQLSGRVWFDANHDRIDNDGAASGRQGWVVELIKRANPLDNSGYLLIAQTTTDSNGNYTFTGVVPNSAAATDRYEIRFRHPQNSAVYGQPVSTWPGVDLTYSTIRDIRLNPGDNAINQNLPLDPSGVVYNSVTRQPVGGATVTIGGPGGFNAAIHLVGGLGNLSQLTAADGYYQFLLLPGSPAGAYILTVTAPAGYLPFPSTIIPSCTTALTVALAPNPLLIQNSNTAPATGIPLHAAATCPAASGGVAAGAGTTQYYLTFNITPGASANTVNNHIPIDPILGGAIIMQKTTPLVNVSKGDLVPYTMIATNTLAGALTNIDVRDRIPPGFKYRQHSGRVNGTYIEPQISGGDFTWTNLTFAAGEKKTFSMVLVVGSGVGEGEYRNQIWAMNSLVNTMVSNIATATVRVIPDPTFDCTDIIGKVFDDKNTNGYQDEGEPGIPNVRLATARGLLVTTDAEGRFHIPCAIVPDPDRGSNFVMKVDERTLPTGYRITTENPRDVRATRGKMVKINFGAAIHRVIRIDINSLAFVSDSKELLPEWKQKIEKLKETLKEKPSVIRIAYRKIKEEPKDRVTERIKHIEEVIRKFWKSEKDQYVLLFEEEIEEVR